MNIIVLIKQVPATESVIQVNDDGISIKADTLKWVLNPYDELAVEEAIRIRDAMGGEITLISVGPEKATEAIRTGLAMGADKGILVTDPEIRNFDGSAIAEILAQVIRSRSFDLIITGLRAVDDDGYYVGAAVAELLSIPSIPMVVKQTISDKKIQCHRTVEGGTIVVEAQLPVLITTQRGLNEPRYASLPGIMKAKKKPLEVKKLADIGISAEKIEKIKTRIVSLRPSPERKGGRVIEGETASAKVTELVRLLQEEAGVL